MNKVALVSIIGGIMLVAGAATYLFDRSAQVNTTFTEEQLNACAAEAALETYMKWNVERDGGVPNRKEAERSLAIDGYRDILGTAHAYMRRFGELGPKTIYEGWMDQAPAICRQHQLRGEPIDMPNYELPPEYTESELPRRAASQCTDGYRMTRLPARPDGSGGCQKNQ